MCATPPVLLFDLAAPATYLAAERADRLLPGLVWRPALLRPGDATPPREVVEARARALGLPLVWPEGHAAGGRRAMRVAALAAERRRAAPFVLAAARLAFCGGFDLDDPETLAEATAAAGLGLDDALAAARDRARDAALAAEGARLRADGGLRLPAIRVGARVLAGEEQVEEAARLWRTARGRADR